MTNQTDYCESGSHRRALFDVLVKTPGRHVEVFDLLNAILTIFEKNNIEKELKNTFQTQDLIVHQI